MLIKLLTQVSEAAQASTRHLCVYMCVYKRGRVKERESCPAQELVKVKNIKTGLICGKLSTFFFFLFTFIQFSI